MTRQHTDIALSAASLALAWLVYAQAAQIPPSILDPVGAGYLPRALALILAGLALLLAVNAMRHGSHEIAFPQLTPALLVRPTLAAVLLFAFIAVMQLGVIDFLPASFAFMAILGAILAERSRRGVIIALLVAAATAVITDVAFTRIFAVILP